MLIPVRTGAASVARNDATPWTRPIPSELWAVVALTALAAALRFATIAHQSYWVDEASTVHELHLSLGAMLHAVHVNETTPPLYFLVAWPWAKLFGTSELGLRSLSALAGTAVVPLVYLCGKELVSRRAGILAAAFAALNPFMIWYSQEARAYMLFALLCGASFLYCARAWRAPSTRNIAWWGAFSALAVLTHFFAAFLVAPEAIWLLVRIRSRAIMIAAGAVAAVQAALLPLALGDTSHPLGWIKAFPLAIRIKQVPVDFGLSTLYQSSLVTSGLLGAGILVAIVLGLLAVGGGRPERRGAAFAAAFAAAVLLVPLLLAELGHDYLVPRNLMPAWIPLAVVLGAACAAPRARPAGAALAAVLLGAFLYAGVRIDQHSQYQRPNWHGVAAALGTSSGPRAIVAYDGGFAAQPLAVYMPGIPWTRSGQQPVTVSEVDVVGSTWQVTASPLPTGIRLLASKPVDDFLVERFALAPSWRLAPAAIGRRAESLLGPAPASPAVLIQHGPT